jgi:RHS repeat-associated protein
VAFEWTPDLRISAERVNGRTVAYAYDEVGNRSSVTTSDGRVIRYDWDARNRLTRIDDSAGGAYEFSYDERDLFREWRGRALVQRFEFNERQFMTRRVAVHGPEQRLVADRAFEYDAQGRLSTIRDAASGVAEYRYDATGALLEARSQAAGGSDERYVWDANGNLTATRRGEGMTYGPGNRLLRAGSRAFGYDDDGSVVAVRDGVEEMALEYDRQGRLSTIRRADGAIVRYRYDPLGRRVAKEVDGRVTRFVWDHGTLLSEADGDGRVTDYLFLPGTHIPVGMMQAGEQFDLVLDQAATPIQAVDVAGESVWSGEMTAFGERRSETVGRVRNPFRFQGQYFDEETGLHYNFTRYYDPAIGRYLSQDPVGTRGGANLYRYVSNPLNWVDPFGLSNLVDGVLRIVPICQWNEDQVKDAEKKMDAMNNKIAEKGGITLPSSPAQRCGKSAKEIYEDCQKKAKEAGETPKRNLNETNTKCTNEQADHIIEICAGGGEKDCNNLQPLNESVNKSYGSQVASAVRQNPGALVKEVVLVPQEEECTDRPSVDC